MSHFLIQMNVDRCAHENKKQVHDYKFIIFYLF